MYYSRKVKKTHDVIAVEEISRFSMLRMARKYAKVNGLRLPTARSTNSGRVCFIDFDNVTFDYLTRVNKLLITIEK